MPLIVVSRMDQKWDRIKQFSTGDACPSTNSLMDSAEMRYRGDRKRSVKSNKPQDELQQQSPTMQQQTMASLEQLVFNAMEDQRFAFESIIKSNSQRLNQMTDAIFTELRACREAREGHSARDNTNGSPVNKMSKRDDRQERRQYLLDRQADLRRQESLLKRDIEGARSAIETIVLVGGSNAEFMDVKLQKLIDIRQDSIDKFDKELFGIEGQMEDLVREMRELAFQEPSDCSQQPLQQEKQYKQETAESYYQSNNHVF